VPSERLQLKSDRRRRKQGRGGRGVRPRAERTAGGGQGAARPAGGRGGQGAQAGARARAAARGRGGLGAQAGARSGQTGGVDAVGNPGAGVAPPAAPAAGAVACRDAAAVQNFGAKEAGRCIPSGGYRCKEKCAKFTAGAVDFLRPLPPLPRAGSSRRLKYWYTPSSRLTNSFWYRRSEHSLSPTGVHSAPGKKLCNFAKYRAPGA
jgi:hypothetical protein